MTHATLHDELDAEQKKVSWIIWVTLAALILFFTWAYFATLDEVTVGTGKVTPSTKAQQIDSLDGGVIQKLLVQEGSIVNKGQLLAQLDPTRSRSSFGEAASRGGIAVIESLHDDGQADYWLNDGGDLTRSAELSVLLEQSSGPVFLVGVASRGRDMRIDEFVQPYRKHWFWQNFRGQGRKIG